MPDSIRKSIAGGAALELRLLLLSIPFLLVHCGPIQIAGGTSEVGNPKSGLHDDEGEGTSSGRVTSFSFDNGTIRVIREKRESPQDTLEASDPVDSVFRE